MEHTGAKPAQQPKRPESLKYVARQPILNSQEQVFAYELLFRDGVDDYFSNPDAESASRNTLDTTVLLGLDVLCDGKRGFINCTRDTLLKDYMSLLPADQAAVEILGSVPADDLVIDRCQKLKKVGYLVSLDDFVLNDPRESLVEFADFVKIDLRTTPLEQVETIVKLFSPKTKIAAKKVETREEFLAAKKVGVAYFQGFFFCKPEVMQARDIPANRLNYVRLMQAVAKDELDPHEVEGIIKSEAALVYRLLRYLNSAGLGIASEIQSVRHGLAMLGEREIRRWIRLVATLSAGQNKSRELVMSALVRARFCELLSPKVEHGKSDLFLIGLLSLMDTILELPMYTILENIPLDHESKAVLLGEKSSLSPLYQLMISRERGEWPQIHQYAADLKLQESFVAEAHWSAMQWARQVSSGA